MSVCVCLLYRNMALESLALAETRTKTILSALAGVYMPVCLDCQCGGVITVRDTVNALQVHS